MSAGPVKLDRDDARVLSGFVGFLVMVAGLWLVYPPAALIVAGGLVLFGAVRTL